MTHGTRIQIVRQIRTGRAHRVPVPEGSTARAEANRWRVSAAKGRVRVSVRTVGGAIEVRRTKGTTDGTK